jgi:hypothetical protein
MSDDFFRTRMGHQFYDVTMPKIADQLERLNKNLEAFVAERRRAHPCSCAARASAAPVAPGAHDESTTEPHA